MGVISLSKSQGNLNRNFGSSPKIRIIEGAGGISALNNPYLFTTIEKLIHMTWTVSAPEGGASLHFFVPERKNGLF